jgi:hypothetical protein
MSDIMPGDRVLVFDWRLFKDDISTPLSVTMKPATVVCRYGALKQTYLSGDLELGPYPDLCDVKFDHREEVSKGHFTSRITKLEPPIG